ncbi:MAG: hypothetical protein COA43_08865 [Robiginitomaculum sp.]|nr:MAG: hypothetical protein COA43_08865 [Robiginitomaculum sp.]
MVERISFSDIVVASVRKAYYRVSTDFGAPIRALRLKSTFVPGFEIYPQNICLGSSEQGLKLLDGRFILGSQSQDVGSSGIPWNVSAPSEPFARKLHSFDWLNDIAAVRLDTKLLRKKPHYNEMAQDRACQFVDHWVLEFGKWNTYAWESDILIHRVFSWLSNWQVLLGENAETNEAKARRACLYRQLKYLRQIYKRTPAGVMRLKAAACLVLGGACFNGKQEGFLDKGLDLLDDELDAQILADGGHISRNPENLVKILEILLITESALKNRGVTGAKEIRRSIKRITPMILFFLAPDGDLFGFNGGGQFGAQQLKKLMKLKPVEVKSFGYAPHMNFQRLARNGTVLMVDVGGSPERPYDLEAHLAPLAFEMCTGAGRLIVNCGWNEKQPQHWREPMRMTAAHSTLVLAGASAGALCKSGYQTRVMGAGIANVAGPVYAQRKEQETGTWIETGHEGYLERYGLVHRRRVYMDLLGTDIRGEDVLYVPMGGVPLTNGKIPFEIRFHLHPNVKVTLAQDQRSALLIQPGGHGWRFRTDLGPLCIEPSVYLAEGAKPRKSEQLVIRGEAYGDGDGQARTNRVRWSLKCLSGVKASELV